MRRIGKPLLIRDGGTMLLFLTDRNVQIAHPTRVPSYLPTNGFMQKQLNIIASNTHTKHNNLNLPEQSRFKLFCRRTNHQKGTEI